VKNFAAQNPIEYPPRNLREEAKMMTRKVQFDMITTKELQTLALLFFASSTCLRSLNHPLVGSLINIV